MHTSQTNHRTKTDRGQKNSKEGFVNPVNYLKSSNNLDKDKDCGRDKDYHLDNKKVVLVQRKKENANCMWI